MNTRENITKLLDENEVYTLYKIYIISGFFSFFFINLTTRLLQLNLQFKFPE